MPEPLTVLFVEDDAAVRKGSEQALRLAGLAVRGFDNAEEAGALIREAFRGILVSDVRLPRKDGIALMKEVVAVDPEIPVILITGHGDVSMAVDAMRAGAYDFIEKPFSSDELVEIVRRALEKRVLVLDNRALRIQLQRREGALLIGDSQASMQLRRLIHTLGPSGADILLHGETGTGKEVAARALHLASGRRGAFVAVNCGALPETVFESEVFGHEPGAFTGAMKRRIGKIEYSQGGTLFLDEIETMPLALQVKLLRVLQDKSIERLGGNESVPVDCRVIAATKTDLKKQSDAGKFRSDLYYRLNVVSIDLPPLRARREDIPALAAHFLDEARRRYLKPDVEIGAELLSRWMTHDWPGNVRELKNAVDRHVLGVDMAAPGPPAGDGELCALADRVDFFERSLIVEELKRRNGQVAKVAEVLQLPKKTLYDKLKKYRLVPDDFRATRSGGGRHEGGEA